MPDRMPDRMPEDMPDKLPEDMPDRMPDRMPEDMSDRMPEDLPVTKRINVMVGITRSKVIVSFGSVPHMWRHVETSLSKLCRSFVVVCRCAFELVLEESQRAVVPLGARLNARLRAVCAPALVFCRSQLLKWKHF